MRPHRLEIEAFGPYAEPVTVPFDSLAREGLFLIHGSTGSGKTYLLDALCFALYGEVSGERSVKGLRSDHAGAEAVPRVALEFSAADGRWRVERQPAYEAVKSRGTGTTSRPAKAALWRLVGDAWEPVAGHVNEVGREITRLVGLDAAQFRQVILLPQGRFAEVLRARPEQREDLLKTLFDTALYERAMAWLDDQARAARGELAEQRRQLAGWREQLGQVWQPWSGAASLDADPNLPEPPQTQAALEQIEAAMAARVAAAQAAQEAAGQRHGLAQAALLTCLTLSERWDRRQTAQQRLAELEQQRGAIEALRQRLERAERAERLRPSLRAQAEAHAARLQAERACRAQLALVRRRRDDAQALPDALVAMDLLQPPAPGGLTSALTALASRQRDLEQWLNLAREASEARTAVQRAEAAVADGQDRMGRGLALVAGHQERRAGLDPQILAARSARDTLAGLEQAASLAQAHTALLDRLEQARRRERLAEAAAVAAEARQQRARRHQLDHRERQLNGMAAQLATQLRSGSPCPVCGSPQHPHPARAAADAVAEEAVQAAERELEAAGAALAQARGDQARCGAQRQELEHQAGPPGTDPAAAAPALSAAHAAAARADAALAEARRQSGSLEELERQAETLSQELSRYEQRLEQLRLQGAVDQEQCRSLREQAGRLQARLDRELGEGLEPAVLLEQVVALAQALAELAELSQTWGTAATREGEAQRRLAEDLRGAGFDDPPALEGALAEAELRGRWQGEIQRHAEEQLRQRGVLAEADLQDLPEERPDPSAARQELERAEAERERTLEQRTRASGAHENITALVASHRQGEQRLGELQAKGDLVNGLADRCWGRTQPHISLQRWVLSAYLEEICGHANQRLGLMSAGRYELRLSDESGQRRGSKAGLGLRVLDAFTGEEREVSSLSGGETFQASLALALGVADTVQAHSGGVQLDALFIDEGFGSLDADSLQLAMDELDRLREGGRMIGLISHVGALRERIRSGIAVVGSERGSRLVVGTLVTP